MSLYQEIWTEPIQHVATRYNISDVGLGEGVQEAQHSAAGLGLLGVERCGESGAEETCATGDVGLRVDVDSGN
jgi:hypothetical protein